MGPLAFLGGSFWLYVLLENSNTLKSNNSLFRGLIYKLKTDNDIIDLIGQDIEYDSTTRVKGSVNVIKGVADIEFKVKGTKGWANVKFVGERYKNTDFWVSKVFTVDDKPVEDSLQNKLNC